MIVPPISRMGGKSKLRKKIIALIPEHICYVEPFFGAGWVFFGKEKSEVEVINDTDKELVNLFRVIKYHPEEVERLLQYEIVSRDSFQEYLKIDISKLTDVQRAIRYLYIISNSFASKGVSFGYGAIKKPSQKIYTDQLTVISDRLKNTYVENLDAKEIIDRYDRKNTFFFCDPPYLDTSQYADKFVEKDHIELRNRLLSIEGKFLLTLNDTDKTRELYKSFNIKEELVSYSISRSADARKNYKELIITNY